MLLCRRFHFYVAQFIKHQIADYSVALKLNGILLAWILESLGTRDALFLFLLVAMEMSILFP